MIALESPIWLVLILPMAVIYSLRQPRDSVSRWLWILTLCVIVLGIAGPKLTIPSRHGTVIVIADRSQSMPDGALSTQEQWIGLLANARPEGDLLGVVSVASKAAVEAVPQAAEFSGFTMDVAPSLSNLAEGLWTATSLVGADESARFLLLTDGQWTGIDPAAVSSALGSAGIPLDYRIMQRPATGDVSIERIDSPVEASPGEAYMMTAWVHAPVPQSLRYELQRNGETVASGVHVVEAGLNRLVFRDRAPRPGTLAYKLHVVSPDPDPLPENNLARFLVGVRGPLPVLHVAPDIGSGLANLLKAGGLNVAVQAGSACDFDMVTLSGYASVIIENTPARALGNPALEALASWVEHRGGGLMLTGGRNMFGPGGYFKSPLDPVLPVSMELRKEHRKLKLAIAVALDRSGSMNMAAGGGRTKMDLANLGTVQVLDLLSDEDQMGVVAVDSSPHVIVDMDDVGRVRGHRSRILSIGSQGGGIFIYEALVAASRMLLDAQAGTRHIILFADAADSEEPGEYVALLKKCREANITVSVVGLGKETDVDAGLLRDIAVRGEGRCFFTEDPHQIPQLFAQDTFAVARSTFIEDPTEVELTGGLVTILGKSYDAPPAVGGYNLCYLRPKANLAGVTRDSYSAPLVASWEAGNGRVLCYTGEADGKYSGAFGTWDQVGDFYTGLARWVSGVQNSLPAGMVVTESLDNGICRVDLHLPPERQKDPFDNLPKVGFLKGVLGKTPDATYAEMKWQDADRLSAMCTVDGSETVLATLFLPDGRKRSLPPMCLPYSPEYRPADPMKGRRTLERLAAATGGEERLNLTEIWAKLPRRHRSVSLGPWVFGTAILFFLLGVFHRRTGLLFRTKKAPSQAVEEKTGGPVLEPPKESILSMLKIRNRLRKQSITAQQTSEDKQVAPEPAESQTQGDNEGADSKGSTLSAMRRIRGKRPRS